jgi:hypothetical protein
MGDERGPWSAVPGDRTTDGALERFVSLALAAAWVWLVLPSLILVKGWWQYTDVPCNSRDEGGQQRAADLRPALNRNFSAGAGV